MTEYAAKLLREEPRFYGNKAFEKRVPFSSKVMYDEETEFVRAALEDGETGTTGKNIDIIEEGLAAFAGVKYAVALNSRTAAIHMAVKLAAERLYGASSGITTPDGSGKGGALSGKRVFCPDFAPASVVNPVIFEGGEPVFVDMSRSDFGMDPEVLRLAFARYPDVKLVIMYHAYGFLGQIAAVRNICNEHEALLIEDASECPGASVNGKRAGSFGDYGMIGFGEESIIPVGVGSMLLVDDDYSARKVRYWSAGAHADAKWNQHEELGYEYGLNNVAAGMIRGQIVHLEEHRDRKKEIYEHYRNSLNEEMFAMNPAGEDAAADYSVSCVVLESGIQFQEMRSERKYQYLSQHGTAAPMEILDALDAFNAECRLPWKPLSAQPVYGQYDQFTLDGGKRTYELFYRDTFFQRCNESSYVFAHGLCLPSGLGMTIEEQDRVIDIIRDCFRAPDFERKQQE